MTVMHILVSNALSFFLAVVLLLLPTKQVLGQQQVYIDATEIGNGIMFSRSEKENIIIFPRHLLEDGFFDNENIRATTNRRTTFSAANYKVHGDLDIALFISEKADAPSTASYQFDSEKYTKGINFNKTRCYLSKCLIDGESEDQPIFLIGEVDNLLVIKRQDNKPLAIKTDSGSGLYTEVDGERVFLGFLISDGKKGDENIAYIFPAKRIHELYTKELTYRETVVVSPNNIVAERPAKQPVALKKNIVFPVATIATGVTIGALLGHTLIYRPSRNLYDDYSTYTSEAEFLENRPEFASRSAAYDEAESRRKTANAVTIAGGVITTFGILKLVTPLFDKKVISVQPTGNSFGLIVKF